MGKRVAVVLAGIVCVPGLLISIVTAQTFEQALWDPDGLCPIAGNELIGDMPEDLCPGDELGGGMMLQAEEAVSVDITVPIGAVPGPPPDVFPLLVPRRKPPCIPSRLAHALVCAHEASPECHVRIQAAFQEHIDNAVSKTVNLPHDAKPEHVDKAFRLAYRLGCKGITVYRDGSRSGRILSKASPEEAEPARMPRPRQHVTAGHTFKYRMGCGTLFVTVNRDENGLCEVFANLGKRGGCPSQSEATCRALSVGLRSGIDPAVLIEQLKGIRCLSTCVAKKSDEEVEVLSCPDAIARAIEEALGQGDRAIRNGDIRCCPECGAPLRKEEGCLVCKCGFSNCG